MKRGPATGAILIVDDEEKIRLILAAILRDEGHRVETARDGTEAIAKAPEFRPEVALIDLQMPGMDGIETSRRLKSLLPRLVTIILTAHGSIHSAVQAIKEGVYDYITKPFDNDQIVAAIGRGLELCRLTEEVDHLKRELHRRYGLEAIVGESPAIGKVRAQILQVAGTDATVLIEGESGTGKELAARAIHYESARKNNPLVIVDCAAIPTNLIESEFFGHEKGAFTDARERRAGKFEEADTGTIFLDEVGELPLEAQTRLLRVLQEKEFTRIGGTSPVTVDVRIIAATNKDLERQTNEGKFRGDLFYRLNVVKVTLPPLREHREDIPLYVDHFMAKYRDTLGKSLEGITDDALLALGDSDWRGNVRELENVVQRAMLHASGERISRADLESPVRKDVPAADAAAGGLEAATRSLLERAEREIILGALKASAWNRTEAAERLRISRKTLFNKMQQYGLKE